MEQPTPPRYNWVARLAAFFIAQKQLSAMLALLVVGFGVFSLLNLRSEGFPQVPVKVVVINTIYKGAGSAEVEQAVTNPIETELKEAGGVKELQSTSNDNASVIQAILEPDANTDAVIQDITSKVSGVSLPKEAEKPDVFLPSTGDSSFIYGLTGGTSPEQLLAQGKIFSRELAQVKGIKDVKQDVEVKDQIKVVFDGVKLAQNGVDGSSLAGALAAANVSIPGGQLDTNGKDRSVLISSSLTTIDQLRAVRIPTADGSVTLSDIATVSEALDTNDKISQFGYTDNGTLKAADGLIYRVDTRSDADILKTEKLVSAELERLKNDKIIDPGVRVVSIVNNADATRQQIQEIQHGAFGSHWDFGKSGILQALGAVGYLFGGIWLLAIAMAIFVNLRAALVAAISVPLSFLVTVGALYIQGVTLNTLTLFSMILVLGLVVDPVIVVLEALQRYKDRGYRGLEAALLAVDSVGLGVLMAVMISAIVFTPFGIVSGTFGAIIKFIPITVIPALIASFFIPVLFLTSIGNRILKSHPNRSGGHGEEASLWRASLWFQRVNRSVLSSWWKQILIIVIAASLPIGIAGAMFATGQIKSVQFSTPNDTENAIISVSYPIDNSLDERKALLGKVEASLNRHPEITSYYILTQGDGSLMMVTNLTKVGTRDKTASELTDEINTELPSGNGVYSKASTLSAGPPAADFPVSLQVYDNDQAKLRAFSTAAADYMKTVDGVTRTSDGYRDGGGELLRITPNRGALANAGLTPAAFSGQVAGLTGEQPLTKLQTPDGEVDVVGSFGAKPAGTAEALKAITIVGSNGPTTVGALANVEVAPVAGTVAHFNGNRYATIKTQIGDDADQFAIQKKLKDWADTHRTQYGLREDAFESKGEGDEIAKSFTQLFQALAAAILLTYVVLAVFFRSFLQPLIITFAVPLSFIGVFPVLVLFNGGQFGFLEILGMITLVGIVENVGIFVIDYANRRIREGMHHKDAIALATAVRFRPIFLTKVCALGSLLPLAIISPFWRGLAGVIVAGILTSGITSLFTTPILYNWSYNLSHFGEWRKHRKTPKPPKTPRAPKPPTSKPVEPSEPPRGHDPQSIHL